MAVIAAPDRLRRLPGEFVRFLHAARTYRRMPGAEPIRLWDLWPELYDRTETSIIDPHYVHQGAWGAKCIARRSPAEHIDVGSYLPWVAFLTCMTQVVFIDMRPLGEKIEGVRCIAGDLLSLPLKSRSVHSLSCLHVAEHIGLGRYGDGLEPRGTQLAARELSRVLAPGGELLFSVPVGRPRLCFNAHRIHSPGQILRYFADLQLVDFSLVDDSGRFRPNSSPAEAKDAHYACGMFRFRRAALAS